MEVKKRTEKLGEVDGKSDPSKRDDDLPDLETIPIVVDVLNRCVLPLNIISVSWVLRGNQVHKKHSTWDRG